MRIMSTMGARLGVVLSGLALLLVGLTAQAGTITYFHNDLAGSPLVATNEQGQVVWRESYRPYGERTVNAPAASGNAVWFTSRRQDAQTGLVYMGARHYDPVAGRFVSVDPVGFDEANLHSFNRYAYANNNPYRYVDPDGRSPVLLLRLFGGGAIGGAAGAAADAVSQYAAFGSVDWGMAAQSNAAQEGAAAGALSFLPAGTPAGLGIKSIGGEAATSGANAAELTSAQLRNLERFAQKLPANAKDSVSLKALPNDGLAAQAVSPGRVPGSSAVYEKQIDAAGKTIQFTKTTYDPAGNIVHVKDKITGGVFP